jgi:glycosyltransferase involved in cell wall biosynthesis
VRILVITNEWPTPASPRSGPFIARQVEHLRRAGMDVEVFHFRGGQQPWNYAKAWLRLRGVLRRRCYDLIHAQFGQSALVAMPKRLPLVVTFRGCELNGIKGPDGRATRAGRVLQRLCQWVAHRADAVIVVSAAMRSLLSPSLTVDVLPSGLDLSLIPTTPPAEARRRLGLGPDERLVLWAGDPADTVKRFWLAEAAFSALRQRLDARNGPVAARLVAPWPASHADILLYMRACDVLLLTSMQEGSSNVVKEALACGLPVASVSVGDVPQRIGGVAGCEICEEATPEALASALERILERGQRIDGRDAIRDLDENLLTQRLIAIYQRIVPGAGSGRTEHLADAARP